MRKTIVFIVIVISLFLFLNMEVSIFQGVDYQVRKIKMPLYLKLLDFFDRHYNYKLLVKEIVREVKPDEEKVLRLFEWTNKNIKSLPSGFPVMDDHAWYTIVRGYGVRDQFHDVFATLCNYAGLNAFFSYVYSSNRKDRIPLSFVRIRDKWAVFDAYKGVYFKDKKGGFADIETIKNNEYILESITDNSVLAADYAIYIDSLSSIKNFDLSRSNTQSPINRLLYELKERFR